MERILRDRFTKREVRHQYFFDQFGDCYINSDPYGTSMDGGVIVSPIKEDHVQYEVFTTEVIFLVTNETKRIVVSAHWTLESAKKEVDDWAKAKPRERFFVVELEIS